MKSTAIATLVTAASLGFASLAQAQDEVRPRHARIPHGVIDPQFLGGHPAAGPVHRGHDNRRHDDRRYDNRRHESHRHDGRRYDHGRVAHGHPGYTHYDNRPYYVEAPRPHYYRGGYVPYEYRGSRYAVSDWHNHHLYAPPQGYQWVRSPDNTNYALIAIATGLIAAIALSQ